MTKRDSILKSRDITLPTKVHLVKAMVFPVVMYGCELHYKESWVLKNRCFWTVVLEKTWESLGLQDLTTSPSLKEISPGCSLEGLMLELKLQYFGHLMRRADSFERPWFGDRREGDDRGWDGWMAITNSTDMSLGELQELAMDREAWRTAFHGVAKSWTQLRDWTELSWWPP